MSRQEVEDEMIVQSFLMTKNLTGEVYLAVVGVMGKNTVPPNFKHGSQRCGEETRNPRIRSKYRTMIMTAHAMGFQTVS